MVVVGPGEGDALHFYPAVWRRSLTVDSKHSAQRYRYQQLGYYPSRPRRHAHVLGAEQGDRKSVV